MNSTNSTNPASPTNAPTPTTVLAKLQDKTARVAVVGLGYVGLPLVKLFLASGVRVVGLDIDPGKVAMLNNGCSYIAHIEADSLKQAVAAGRFLPSTEFRLACDADAVILCVPTPFTAQREPDLSYVTGSLELLLPFLRPGQVLSLESTTYPGTTEEVIRPRLERAGFIPGENFHLVYSPEREDPNNGAFSTRNIPKLVGGSTPACLETGLALYRLAVEKAIPVSSPAVAEMAKILENAFRAVNIALVNELKQVAHGMGIDIFEVIRAAASKPFGYMPFYPGPGLGGHCIPIDPFYLTWKARECGLHTRFIELAGEVNTAMPEYVATHCMLALNSVGKAVNGARVLILGVAYKKNVDDMRESPAMELMARLTGLGAAVSYSDPHVPRLPKQRKYAFDLESTSLDKEALAGNDLVVIATDHDAFDWTAIKRHAPLIVDPRGIYAPDGKRIFRA